MDDTKKITGDNIAPQATPIKADPIPVDKVMIDKLDLEKLFSTIAEQNKKIDVLFEAADKGRLARIQGGVNGESLIKVVKVSKWPDNGMLILGWKLTHNQSEIVNGRWIEKQDALLIFEDGTSLEVSLLDFYRKVEKEKAEIVSRTKKEDAKGKEIQFLKLRFNDGKTIEIDSTYIN